MNHTVTIWHNVGTDEEGRKVGMFRGYAYGQPLVPVAQYTVTEDDVPADAPLDVAAQRLANDAFRLFNVGDDPDFGTPDARAVAYRQRRNRSLSVGDVVQVDTIWLACASAGWNEMSAPKWIVRDHDSHGTHSLPESARVHGVRPVDADDPQYSS